MSDIIKREGHHSDEMTIFDETNATAVYNLVGDEVKDLIKAVPMEAWDMSIFELANKSKIGIEEKKLRVAFWLEYERAMRQKSTININHVTKGIVTGRGLAKKILADPYKLAYIMTPPEDYKVKLEEMLVLAMDEERKILELPIERVTLQVDKNGDAVETRKIDTSLATLKHKIRESLQNRAHGAVAQNIKQVSINKNYNTNSTSPNVEEMADKDLTAYVEELKNQSESTITDVVGVMDDIGGIKDDS